MRTENFRRSVVSILLVFGLVSSMILVAPLASPGVLISDPGGENIKVVAGSTFLIRHTLEWNEPENGSYAVSIGWDCYGNHENENFTFVGASAYFTTGPHENEPINADIMFGSAPSDYPGSTRYALSVSNPDDNEDPRNGQFNVDITLGAYGAGGVPHIATNNHPIPFQMGGAIVIEGNNWDTSNRDPINIKVLGRGVSVTISPSENSGFPSQTLNYTVTVKNTGNLGDDNYDLTAGDNVGWNPTLSENLLETVGPGENRMVTLSVTVPENATSFDQNNILVTATSVENAEVTDSEVCIARVPGKAIFGFVTLFKISLDVDLYLGQGSKLVVKFYTWGGYYQGENVVWSGTTPDNVSFSKIVPHPYPENVPHLEIKAVEWAKLVLTDAEGVTISTLSTFSVTRSMLRTRFRKIPIEWALARTPEEKDELRDEFRKIPLQWGLSPC